MLSGGTLTLLKELHIAGKVNLGYFYTIIQRCEQISTAIYNATYLPLKPILIPILWGGSMNIAMDPDLPFPGPIKLTIITLATAGVWFWWGCFPNNEMYFMKQVSCTRACGEAIFSSFLMLGMMFATWIG
jgi:hypothetical protein